MTLQVKELDCPNCGASLSAQNARKAKTLVCHNCGSQIDLTSPEYAIIGQATLGVGSAQPKSPIRLGQRATFDGVTWMVVGRVRYRDRGHWDEWLLMSEDGEYQWLVESDGFTLYQPFVPANPVDPHSAGASIDLEGIPARVREKGRATIEYLEGELTWKARLGDVMHYLDARHADGVYSIEWSEREIEFFKGQKVNKSTVYKAFGFKRPRRRTRKRVKVERATTDDFASTSSVAKPFAAIWVFVILTIVFVGLSLACLICGCLPAGTGQTAPGSGSTWTTPATGSLWPTATPGSAPSIRIGSPSGGSGFSGGGGFSGGK